MKEPSGQTEHKPTLRTISILELLAAEEGKCTLTEIARGLDSSPSTLFPIVHTLRSHGYLNYDEQTQAYSLGLRLFELGCSLRNTSGYDDIVEIMTGIVDACGETCHFGVLDKGNVLYLAKVDSKQPVRMFSRIGRRLPAYGTAIGKALLKDCSLEDLKEMYPHGLEPLTEHTVTDFNVLIEQLGSIDPFAYESEESNESVCCVAIPIYKNSRIYGAISVAMPVFRYDEDKRRRIEIALREASVHAERIVQYLNL
ncbi:MAG: IclR family transcriptional regulator [Synergistaceae bacterium]|jgi:DNA-binding IclR family transcriptional regulator|nr:IclR family transcriptional regulator [Synergistaceae bacterium]